MANESRPFSYRLEPAIDDLLNRLAERKRLTQSMMLEWLIIEAAKAEGLLETRDRPNAALFELFDLIRTTKIPAQSDFTKLVFQEIQETPKALRLWEQAVGVPAGENADRRRQFVNSRIGRFCKLHIDWDSHEEVILPRNAGMLIKGYTRLAPKRARK